MTSTAPHRPGVAAGHPVTTAAAVDTLLAGGNAFDAVVAAAFTASVAEPMLTSMAGGGFCLTRHADGRASLVDFFVDVPGLGRPAPQPQMHTIQVSFTNTTQEFHAGWGSVATPGCLEGWLHVHDVHGRLPLPDVLAPARSAAADGVEVNDQQAYIFQILHPINVIEPDAASRFAPGGHPLAAGDVLVQDDVAAFLDRLATDRVGAVTAFRRGLVGACEANGGAVTEQDLAEYAVVDRAPLRARYRSATVLTNPAPGGQLIADQLASLDEGPPIAGWDDPSSLRRFVDAQLAAERRRHRAATQGTTHISVADAEGNVASMTTSNGSGSGCLIPGIGVVCNNMLGEDDLFPGGLGTGVPGERVASMMSPSVVIDGADDVLLVVGSGGSKRIRTAMTQVIARVIDHEPDIERAVRGPRVHHDGHMVQVEPGFAPNVLAALPSEERNDWLAPDLYFGGVHAVTPAGPGRPTRAAGDPRRGGAATIV